MLKIYRPLQQDLVDSDSANLKKRMFENADRGTNTWIGNGHWQKGHNLPPNKQFFRDLICMRYMITPEGLRAMCSACPNEEWNEAHAMRCRKFGPGIRSHMHNAGRDCEYEVCRMGGAESLKLEPRMCHYAQLMGGAPGPNAQEQHALRADIMVGGIFSETDNKVIDNRTANWIGDRSVVANEWRDNEVDPKASFDKICDKIRREKERKYKLNFNSLSFEVHVFTPFGLMSDNMSALYKKMGNAINRMRNESGWTRKILQRQSFKILKKLQEGMRGFGRPLHVLNQVRAQERFANDIMPC